MIYDVLAHICALAGLAAFCYRLPELLQRRTDPALWALAVYFLCSGLSFLIDLNWLRDHVSGFFGYPNLTTIMTQAAVVVLTAAQQVVLVHWSHPPEQARLRAKRRVLAFSVALVALVALFFIVEPYRQSPSAEGTLLRNMRDVDYAGYLLFYITICAVGQVGAVRLSYRYARIARRTWLRTGMWTVTAGASFILLYCAIRYTQTIGTQLGFDMSSWEPAYWLAGDIGSLLQLFGWTVPSWGPAVSAWVANYRSYLRLRPLWWALYDAVPAIALEPPPSRALDRLPPSDLEYRLYRRVIEILDGYHALRPHLAHAAARHGHPPDRARHSPADEARFLKAALRARAEGSAAPPSPAASVPPPFAGHRDDFAEEVAWLTEVARSFARISSSRITARDE
ncbi:MAB_1171c family putative transporter [Streptomyces macrosporus]